MGEIDRRHREIEQVEAGAGRGTARGARHVLARARAARVEAHRGRVAVARVRATAGT